MRVMLWLIAMLGILIGVMLFCCGCCSTPGHPAGGWSVSLVNVTVQLGGSRTDPTIVTRNELGPDSVQTHTLPVRAEQTAGATSAGVPLGAQ